jgi:hypothetical protein
MKSTTSSGMKQHDNRPAVPCRAVP